MTTFPHDQLSKSGGLSFISIDGRTEPSNQICSLEAYQSIIVLTLKSLQPIPLRSAPKPGLLSWADFPSQNPPLLMVKSRTNHERTRNKPKRIQQIITENLKRWFFFFFFILCQSCIALYKTSRTLLSVVNHNSTKKKCCPPTLDSGDLNVLQD